MSGTDLRIPGPTPLPPAVKRAMQRDMINHRGDSFRRMFARLLLALRRIHQTEGDVVVLPGSGSAGWEAAIVNTLSPEDTVVSFIAGDFAARFARVADAFGLEVVRVEVPWGQAVTPAVVLSVLDAHPEAKAVLYTYNETSTGIAHPLAEVGPLVRRHGALLLVDAVSAAGGLPLAMDDWGVDLVLSGSQKAWMAPPGLVILGVGPRVWDAYAHARLPRFFWDLRERVEAGRRGELTTTAPLTALYGLDAAVRLLEAEGMAQVYARHARLGQFVRDGVQALGYRLFGDPAYASNTVTAIVPPDELSAPAVVAAVRAQTGIELAGGQAHLKDAIIRIGHMGWVHQPELERALAALGVAGDQGRGDGR